MALDPCRACSGQAYAWLEWTIAHSHCPPVQGQTRSDSCARSFSSSVSAVPSVQKTRGKRHQRLRQTEGTETGRSSWFLGSPTPRVRSSRLASCSYYHDLRREVGEADRICLWAENVRCGSGHPGTEWRKGRALLSSSCRGKAKAAATDDDWDQASRAPPPPCGLVGVVSFWPVESQHDVCECLRVTSDCLGGQQSRGSPISFQLSNGAMMVVAGGSEVFR